MLRRALLTLTAIGAIAMLGACSNIQQKNQANILDRSLKAYAGAIRWGNYDTAAAFAVPRDGAPQVHPNSLRDIKVTGYNLRINSINEPANEANVHMSFSYYNESQGTIGTVTQDAIWYFISEDTGWLMDDSLPKFIH